jgi:hypothetical protein
LRVFLLYFSLACHKTTFLLLDFVLGFDESLVSDAFGFVALEGRVQFSAEIVGLLLRKIRVKHVFIVAEGLIRVHS